MKSKIILLALLVSLTSISKAQNTKSYNHWEQEIEVDDFGDFKNYEYYYGTYEAPDYLTQVTLELTPDYLRIYRLNSQDQLLMFDQNNQIKIKDETGNITTSSDAIRTNKGGLHFPSTSNIYRLVNNNKTQQLKFAIYNESQNLISTFSIWSLQPDWN